MGIRYPEGRIGRPGRSEDVMSGKSGKGAAKAVPRAYGRLTGHKRDTARRMPGRGASCREIARELGRSPSTVSAEVSSHRFVTAPKPRRGERVDVPLGELDLTPGLIGRAREERGDARCPSLKGKRNRRTGRPAEPGKRCRAEGGAWPPGPSKHISTVPSTGKMTPPGPGRGLGGVRLTAGTAYPLNVFG